MCATLDKMHQERHVHAHEGAWDLIHILMFIYCRNMPQQDSVARLKNSEIKSREANSCSGILIMNAILISYNFKFDKCCASDVGRVIAAGYNLDFRTNCPVPAEFYDYSVTGNEVQLSGKKIDSTTTSFCFQDTCLDHQNAALSRDRKLYSQ